jgi:hypothetical protein
METARGRWAAQNSACSVDKVDMGYPGYVPTGNEAARLAAKQPYPKLSLT